MPSFQPLLLNQEKHLYFGVNNGCRLTADDYMGVMGNLGFTQATARSLYQELMDAFNQTGDAIRKRDEVHRMADANKAFSHFARF